MPGKKFGFLAILIFTFWGVNAQPIDPRTVDLTGLWKGTFYNDSANLAYRYEIAISEEKGKLTGYSHTWFIVDDKQYYGVKKLKIKIEGSNVIIEDNGTIAHNYPAPPPKGIKLLSILTLERTDSTINLRGECNTNATRKYAAIPGRIDVQRKYNFQQSSLMPHLQELGLDQSISFVKKMEAEKKQPILATIDSRRIQTGAIVIAAPEKEQSVTATDTRKESPAQQATGQPVSHKEISATPSPEKQANTKAQPKEIAAADPASVKKVPQPETREIPVTAKPIVPVVQAAADFVNRKTEIQQVLSFHADSLVLSLYDNGEVDGDSVSVLYNGKLILEKQGLSTKAIRKTIYIEPTTDSIALVMYAESMGSIPPNTGLLVVKDGSDIYEVRFSGDTQRNAAILFKRRK